MNNPTGEKKLESANPNTNENINNTSGAEMPNVSRKLKGTTDRSINVKKDEETTREDDSFEESDASEELDQSDAA